MGCCQTLTGFIRDCDANVGGIKRVWVGCFDNVQTPTVTNEEISAIVIPTEGWAEYEFRKQTGSFTETITTDQAIGSLYYESEIVLQFTKQETEKRIEIKALAVSDIAMIIEDNNGEFHYFGYFRPVTMSTGTIETGTAFADLNGYNLTFNSIENEPHYLLSQTAIDQLLGTEEEA